LAASVAAAATTSTVAGSASVTSTALKGWAAIMAMTKAQSAIVSVIATLLVGTAVVVGGAKAIQLLTTRSTPSASNVAATAIAGPTITGIVRDPDGQPIAGAECIVATGAKKTYAYPAGPRWRRDGTATASDSTGRYVLPKPEGSYAVMIRSPKGYAEVSGSQLESSGADVTLQRWARIEGVAKVGDTPLANTDIRLWRVGDNDEPIHHETSVKTDAAGRFVFPQVAPGEACVYRQLPNFRSAQWRYVQVEPGQTANVPIGGNGRSVVGRVDVPPEMQEMIAWTTEGIHTYDAQVRRELATSRGPEHPPGEPLEQYWAKELEFGKTPEGKLWKEWRFGSHFMIDPDGSFRVDDLPAGKYKISVRCFESDEEVHFGEDVANVEMRFEIPDAGAGDGTPMDLGAATPKLLPRLPPGATAPDFTVKTIDGGTWRLADHKGKPLVLICWGTYSNTDKLKDFGEFAQRWGKDERVSILGCFVARDLDEAKKFIAQHKLDFPHTADSSLMNLYHCSWPGAVVVSADGKIMQKHLHEEVLEKYVTLAVADAPTTQPTRNR
jgi:peroxiredoxin